MEYVQGEDENQIILFPESVDDYITEENAIRVIDAFVMYLDMEKLGFTKAIPDLLGRPHFDPKDLLKLYLYGYMNRIRSAIRLENEAARNVEIMWLINKLTPDFKTIADFRKDNKEAIIKVFKQFTLLCKEWSLFVKELVAVDGTKFRASNSKKNNFNNKKIDKDIKYIYERS